MSFCSQLETLCFAGQTRPLFVHLPTTSVAPQTRTRPSRSSLRRMPALKKGRRAEHTDERDIHLFRVRDEVGPRGLPQVRETGHVQALFQRDQEAAQRGETDGRRSAGKLRKEKSANPLSWKASIVASRAPAGQRNHPKTSTTSASIWKRWQ